MKRDNNSGDIRALTTIVSVLQDLDNEAQIRTLQAVATFLGLPLSESTGQIYELSQPRIEMSQKEISFSENRAMSAKEFIRDKQPRTDVERVACLAYYLTHYRETPHFKTIDISTLNTEAAQSKFSNAAKSVANAVRAGLIVQAVKGAKQISAAGEIFVQLLPDYEAARSSLANIKSKRRSKGALKKKAGRNNGQKS